MARIKVRKGMPSVPARQGAIRRATEAAVPRSRLRAAASRDRQDHRCRLGRLRRQPQVAVHPARRARAMPIPSTSCRSTGWPQREAIRRGRAAAEVAVVEVAHPADQRLAAQRPDLPGRDVQELPADGDRRGGRSSASAASRSSGSTSTGRPRSSAARSIPARPACRRRCRSATGRAPAIPTIRSARPTTGWTRSIRCGRRRTAS